MIKAINIKTGDTFTFKDEGSNLHLFHLNFSPLEWKLEFMVHRKNKSSEIAKGVVEYADGTLRCNI